MSLITPQYVIDRFPKYQYYFVDENDAYDVTILQTDIDLAEDELADYISVDETTVTDSIKRHIFNITRKKGFDRRHGDTDFETKPTIVRDYENTIKILEQWKEGAAITGATPGRNSIYIEAKKRQFDADGGFEDEDQT